MVVYTFLAGLFDPSQRGHGEKLRNMAPIDRETALLLMRNLGANLMCQRMWEDQIQLIGQGYPTFVNATYDERGGLTGAAGGHAMQASAAVGDGDGTSGDGSGDGADARARSATEAAPGAAAAGETRRGGWAAPGRATRVGKERRAPRTTPEAPRPGRGGGVPWRIRRRRGRKGTGTEARRATAATKKAAAATEPVTPATAAAPSRAPSPRCRPAMRCL